MSTARKYNANQRSMSRQSRNGAYAALNILFKQMRPDLDLEDKDTIRAERLKWIKNFLGLRKLESTTDISDPQIGRVLEEMRRLTGKANESAFRKIHKIPESTDLVSIIPHDVRQRAKLRQEELIAEGKLVRYEPPAGGAEIFHLSSPEQRFTLRKLEDYLGWTPERRANFLKPRFKATTFEMLRFDQATALTIQMLNIAAHRDLKKSLGADVKISRKMTAKYIPVLKQKLGIDR